MILCSVHKRSESPHLEDERCDGNGELAAALPRFLLASLNGAEMLPFLEAPSCFIPKPGDGAFVKCQMKTALRWP